MEYARESHQARGSACLRGGEKQFSKASWVSTPTPLACLFCTPHSFLHITSKHLLCRLLYIYTVHTMTFFPLNSKIWHDRPTSCPEPLKRTNTATVPRHLEVRFPKKPHTFNYACSIFILFPTCK